MVSGGRGLFGSKSVGGGNDEDTVDVRWGGGHRLTRGLLICTPVGRSTGKVCGNRTQCPWGEDQQTVVTTTL